MHGCKRAVVVPGLDFQSHMLGEAISQSDGYRRAIFGRPLPIIWRPVGRGLRRTTVDGTRDVIAEAECSIPMGSVCELLRGLRFRFRGGDQRRQNHAYKNLHWYPRILPQIPRGPSRWISRFPLPVPMCRTLSGTRLRPPRHDAFGIFWTMMPMEVAAKPWIANLKCGSAR